jgi:hypothetical protein
MFQVLVIKDLQEIILCLVGFEKLNKWKNTKNEANFDNIIICIGDY